METQVKLIICRGGNPRTDTIAKQYGFEIGCQLPKTIYDKIFFADQDWKNPDRKKYMEALAKAKPHIATVLDLEREDQFDEVIDWAEEASEYLDKIIIIPKYSCIDKIPEYINGKQVILGYSVPTKYGGTEVPIEEFGERQVHLLGGLPHHQLLLYKLLNVYSIDTSYIAVKATNYNCFWTGMYNNYSRIWVQMKDINLDSGPNWNYVALSFSCFFLKKAWQEIQEGKTLPFERKYNKLIQNGVRVARRTNIKP